MFNRPVGLIYNQWHRTECVQGLLLKCYQPVNQHHRLWAASNVRGVLTVLTHLGKLRDLHVEVFAVRLILNLFMVHRLQDLPLFGPEASKSRLQIHLLLL